MGRISRADQSLGVLTEDDPFGNCKLGREGFAKSLTTLVTNLDGPYVLAFNGAYGTGKTTFLRMWEQMLLNEEHQCVYLNAWESDHAEDPLVPVVSALSDLINEGSGSGATEALAKARVVGTHLLKRTPASLIRFLTLNTVDGDEMAKELSKLLGDTTNDIVSDQFKQFEANQEHISEFKKELATFTEKIGSETEGAKLIFLVDELDRCRPSYAVELLERIKHLFDVDRMIFVLGIDQEQLKHSVRARYGSEGFDAPGYLRRFIDLEVALPLPNLDQYIDYTLDRFSIIKTIQKKNTEQRVADLKPILKFLLIGAQVSLREANQMMSRLSVSLLGGQRGLHSTTLAILCFIRDFVPELFDKLATNSCTLGDLDLLKSRLTNWSGAASSEEVTRSQWRIEIQIESFLQAGLIELSNRPEWPQRSYDESRIDVSSRAELIDSQVADLSYDSGFAESLEIIHFSSQFELEL